MKKYIKPVLMNDSIVSKAKGLVPLATIASLSVGGAALVGAALGLASTGGKDFKPRKNQLYLKPTVKITV